MKEKTFGKAIENILFKTVIAMAVMFTIMSVNSKTVQAESPKTYSVDGAPGTIKMEVGTVIEEGDIISTNGKEGIYISFDNGESLCFGLNTGSSWDYDNEDKLWTVGTTFPKNTVSMIIDQKPSLPSWYFAARAIQVGRIDEEPENIYNIEFVEPNNHVHNFHKYSSCEDYIYAHCKNDDGLCPLGVARHDQEGYDHTASLGLSFSFEDEILFLSGDTTFNRATGLDVSLDDVEIYKVETENATTGGTKVTGIPEEAGYYYATLTVQGATAVRAFKIEPYNWIYNNEYGEKIWYIDKPFKFATTNNDVCFQGDCRVCGEKRFCYDKVNARWTELNPCNHFVTEDPHVDDDGNLDSPVYESLGSDKHKVICGICKVEYGEPLNHNFSEKGICNECGVFKTNYLTFTAEEADSAVVLKWDEGSDVKYSTDGGSSWNDYTYDMRIELANVGDKVSFKGTDVITSADNRFSMRGKIAASGDVTSLTNGIGGPATLEPGCYRYMFSGCTSLSTAPNLPSTKLADSCYQGMFNYCTNLRTAPELPATTLADRCYQGMFKNCTNLRTAPELPAARLAEYCYSEMFFECTSLSNTLELSAATLEDGCYSSMFENCTSLSNAPELPATTLTNECYARMFDGCTSLKSAPALPATTLARFCYSEMFARCTSLKSAPALPATTLEESCYSVMFGGCRSLSSAPIISAEILADNCCEGMFSGCTSLKSALELPATTLAKDCYRLMFNECTSLTSAPIISAEILADNCCEKMFNGCTSLISTPELSATTLAKDCYMFMFNGCTSLKNASELPATVLAERCYQSMFAACTSLISAPIISAETLANNCCMEMFNGCESLVSVPALPATTLADYCYQGMFWNCTSLKSAPELPATVLEDSCYGSMFENCTSLISAPALPATTLATWCYNGMFSGCTSLSSAPTLPATALEDSCYSYMFAGCTSLSSVPALPATALADNCYTSMFEECTNLKVVATEDESEATWKFPQTEAEYWNSDMICGLTAPGTLTDVEAGKMYKVSHIIHDFSEQPYEAIEGGKHRQKCKYCDAYNEEPHSYATEYTVDVEPTCTETGSKSIHCINCQEKKDGTDIAALGHSWNEGEVTKESTYTEKGVKTFKCTRTGCAETRTEEIAMLVKDPSHVHVWDDGVVTKEPTYTEKGIKTYTCKEDSSHIKTVEIPTLEKLGDVIAEDADIFTEEDFSSDRIKFVGIREAVYTGSNVTFDVRVYKGTRLLIDGIDYSLKYTNNKEACADLSSSTAPTVTFIGKGIYKNETVEPVKFKINPVDISGLKASNDTVALGNKTYKPVPTLTLNGKKLKANKDYEVIYDDAHKDGFSEIGTYAITLKGINNYTGIVTSTFKVVDTKKYSLMSKASVSGYEKNFKYDGTKKVQDLTKLTVKIGSEPLTLNTDYTVECINNTEAGIASMIIKAVEGSDKYVGEKVITYKILGTPISKAKATIGSTDFDTRNIFYTGKTIKPPVSLELKDGTKLTEGTDYTITYQKNVNVGTAAIIIEGKGAYSGTVKKTFKIKPVVLTNKEKIKVETVGKATKNDKGKYEIEVSVKYNEKPLIKGSDYTVSFKNNTKPGTAKAIIKGKGNYTKTTTVTFEITE